ncbi:ABC transporter permease subunit [Nocardioides plantarum]|uniref:ABC transporter permease subunit n=1 Tax=Nocardioides plantarum TaxID=29299 RepID=A0ABV5KE28_9ACTN|nr:ABC transporter permease subunit [Nocardioides plantarum]
MRLLRVELTRLRWRRAVLLLLAATVLVPVVLAIVKVAELAPPSPDAYEQAVAAAEREAQQPYVQDSIEDCIANPDDYVGTAIEDVEGACRDSYAPVPEQFLPSSLDLAYEREDSGYVAAVFVGMIAILIGTTFVGHDWNTGSMGNQLLFESRRLRVWGAKAVAVTAATGVAAAVGLSAFWFVLAARFQLAGVHVPDGALLAGLEQGWRGAGVAALAALAGFAITMLSRSTVFTLGLLLGIAVAGGLLISFFADDPGWVDPTVNVSAVIQDGTTYYVDVPESCYSDTSYDDTGDCASERRRSLGQGLGYLAILTPVVVGASAVSYRRRDVP